MRSKESVRNSHVSKQTSKDGDLTMSMLHTFRATKLMLLQVTTPIVV